MPEQTDGAQSVDAVSIVKTVDAPKPAAPSNIVRLYTKDVTAVSVGGETFNVVKGVLKVDAALVPQILPFGFSLTPIADEKAE